VYVLAKRDFGVFALAAFLASDDAHERAFTCAIFGNEADFLPLVNVQADILEQDFLPVTFGDVFER
jgi:isopentenyl phosphate kinase